jgi:hypothetical protein
MKAFPNFSACFTLRIIPDRHTKLSLTQTNHAR